MKNGTQQSRSTRQGADGCRRKVFVMLFFVLGLMTAYAQQQVSGTVVDEFGTPLPGATVLVKGTTNGTTTDFDGNFIIEASVGADTLVVSYIGFDASEVAVASASGITVTLKESAQFLDEVVVTALGVSERKSTLSYSTQKVDSEALNVSRIGDVSQQLSAQVAGLQISTSNGSGVSSSRIVLRGESSLNIDNNQPLIIVDGVVISNNLDGITGTDPAAGNNLPVDYGNGLTDFNTDDIQSVNVLKGAKAAALYGARAANGALVITTKNGRPKEGIGIEFNTGISIDHVARFWDEQREYGGGFDNEFRANWGGNYGAPVNGQLISQTTGRESRLGLTPEPTPYLYRLDRKGFFDTGVASNTNLALSFGDDTAWGRVSIARLDRKGIVPNTDYTRDNFSVRFGANLTDKLSVDFSGFYLISRSDNLPVVGIGGEGVINNMFWAMNNYDYNDFRDYWLPGLEGVEQNYFLTWGTNPFLIVNENLNAFKRNRLFGNVKLNYQVNEHFSIFARIGTDYYTDFRTSQRPTGQPNFPNGLYREQDIAFNETNIDFLATYNWETTEKSGFKFTLGGNRRNDSSTQNFFESRDLGVFGVYTRANAVDRPVVVEAESQLRVNSFYGSAQYNYDQAFFVDVTARNDWSSTLPMDENSFFYPSIGTSAVLSRLFELPESIDFLQVRTSLAESGNDTQAFLTRRNLLFGTQPGSVTNPTLLPNTELKPEQTTAFEIGAEIKMFQNRISLDANYYRNVSKNQILQVPISQSSGAVSRLINAGEVRNNGVEVLLKGTPIATKDFVWDASIAWTRNRGEVVELTDDVDSFVVAQGSTGGTVEARPGGRLGDIYGRGFVRDPDGNVVLDIIDLGTRQVVRPRLDSNIKRLGNYNPDWTAGITNSFRYKNFNLRMLMDYRYGGIVVSQTSALLYRSGIITESLPFRTEDFVPQGVVETSPGVFEQNTTASTGQDWYRSNFQATNIEANTYDATFFKLREISLGVDLKPYLESLPFTKINVSLFGRNIWTVTKDRFLRHFDPEALSQNGGQIVPGFEVGQLPTPVTVGMNLNVKF